MQSALNSESENSRKTSCEVKKKENNQEYEVAAAIKYQNMQYGNYRGIKATKSGRNKGSAGAQNNTFLPGIP